MTTDSTQLEILLPGSTGLVRKHSPYPKGSWAEQLLVSGRGPVGNACWAGFLWNILNDIGASPIKSDESARLTANIRYHAYCVRLLHTGCKDCEACSIDPQNFLSTLSYS